MAPRIPTSTRGMAASRSTGIMTSATVIPQPFRSLPRTSRCPRQIISTTLRVSRICHDYAPSLYLQANADFLRGQGNHTMQPGHQYPPPSPCHFQGVERQWSPERLHAPAYATGGAEHRPPLFWPRHLQSNLGGVLKRDICSHPVISRGSLGSRSRSNTRRMRRRCLLWSCRGWWTEETGEGRGGAPLLFLTAWPKVT